MKTEQISVFLENRTGRLAEVTHALAEAGINIRALSLADTTDFGILRMIVCSSEKAKATLKAKGFTIGRTAVIPVEIPNAPGGLDTLLQTVSDSGINVEYMYPLVQGSGPRAVMVFRFDKTDKAVEVLNSKGFSIISPDQICGQ